MPHLDPRAGAYVVAAILALSFSYDLMRKPIQVTDSLVEILTVQQSPSVYAAFVDTAQRKAYLRPLRLVQIKVLFDLANGQYWLVYRGFHALLLTAALFLFVRALRVQTWTDFAAAVFALTVLTGLHTFRGTVREAFPINHFLEIVVFCLIALSLAQSRGGWWIDVAATVTLILASLTLESGLLVWVVVVAAWACGMRGVSRRGVAAMTVLLGLYFWVGFFYLSTGMPGLTERSSGFLLSMLEPEELQQRFGADPTWFYVYNVTTSIMSVLFSEPQSGVFEAVRAWLQGEVPPRLYLATVSSLMATTLIVWAGAARLFGRAQQTPASSDQFFIIFGAVLFANAAVSYAYTKDETMSVAGGFYGFAAFAAARHAIDYVRQSSRPLTRAALCLLLLAVATTWAFRSAGVHHMLRVQAFKERNDWARIADTVYQEPTWSPDERQTAALLVRQLRRDALEMRVTNPNHFPRWADLWWGE